MLLTSLAVLVSVLLLILRTLLTTSAHFQLRIHVSGTVYFLRLGLSVLLVLLVGLPIILVPLRALTVTLLCRNLEALTLTRPRPTLLLPVSLQAVTVEPGLRAVSPRPIPGFRVSVLLLRLTLSTFSSETTILHGYTSVMLMQPRYATYSPGNTRFHVCHT